MPKLDELRERLPDEARDIRLNLGNIADDAGSLTPAQQWGTIIASALTTRHRELAAAAITRAKAKGIEDAVIEDAKAAAVLMGMNNIYYRFKTLVEREEYKTKPARLRMTRIARPAANKVDFELFCLAVSAITGCGSCVKSHEKVVIDGGLNEDQVNDAIRIAAVVHASSIGLDLADT